MDMALESVFGEMRVMDYAGNQRMKWKRDNPDQIAAAKAVFDRLLERGYSAFGTRSKSAPRQTMKTFDPEAADVIMVPKIVGG